MRAEILKDAESASQRTAELIAAAAREAIGAHGSFVMAVSGGTEPWVAFRVLATLAVDWSSVHIAQVDERVAPEGDEDRNLTHLRESLLDRVAIPPGHVHAMPVNEPDLGRAAQAYAGLLAQIAGSPPVFDLVHLGLGTDGHTASLVPADPVLAIRDRDVAVTGEYRGTARMTLTYPMINRARRILWLVPGERKAAMLAKLLTGDRSIPAGRVTHENALVITDRAAAGSLYSGRIDGRTA